MAIRFVSFTTGYKTYQSLKTIQYFHKDRDVVTILNSFGREGVRALESATPEDTGKTSKSWDYRLVQQEGRFGIEWFNTNKTETGIPIAVLIQYGHATRGGGYVQGRDYINPTTRPIFDKIAEDVWKQVSK